jgi:ascorbate-specific PTS system EIIC-type component UlaA
MDNKQLSKQIFLRYILLCSQIIVFIVDVFGANRFIYVFDFQTMFSHFSCFLRMNAAVSMILMILNVIGFYLFIREKIDQEKLRMEELVDDFGSEKKIKKYKN